MRFWFVTPHDAIPGEHFGYGRVMDMARVTAQRGHDVTLIVPSFSHALKRHRAIVSVPETVEGVRVVVLPSPTYGANISLRRLLLYAMFAGRFERYARTSAAPDAIFSVGPTPFLDQAVVRVGRRLRARVVIDFRDLWPEIFAEHLPHLAAIAAQPVFAVIRVLRRRALRAASAVVAINRQYAAFVRKELLPSSPDPVLVYDGIDPRLEAALARQRTPDHGAPSAAPVVAMYAGMLSRTHDIPAMLAAAEILRARTGGRIRIAITGKGPAEDAVRASSNAPGSIIDYHGAVPMNELARLYGLAHIGLVTVSPESTVVMPAKAFDCIAAGLPVITSVAGDYGTLVEANRLGVRYSGGSPESLASAIEHLALDDAARSEMRKRALGLAPTFRRDRAYVVIAELMEGTYRHQPSVTHMRPAAPSGELTPISLSQ